MLMGVVWLSFRYTPSTITIVPTDEQAIQQDWLHLNETSIIEDATQRPYRWLVEQPKQAFQFINTNVNHSLESMNVVISAALGHTSFWIIQSTLQNDAPTMMTITGATEAVSGQLTPTIRRYQWLVPYAFIPQQDHLVPLTNQQFNLYGFISSQPTTSVDDQRIRLARWYGTTYQSITPVIGYILGGTFIIGVWLAVWWIYRTNLRWYVLLSGASVALWGFEWLQTGILTLEPLMTFVVSATSWRLGRWLTATLHPSVHIPIFVSAMSFQGVYSYATAYWMQGVDLTAFNGWADFWSYIATMRMAMPIPLLTIEYAIHWLALPGIWSIGYLAILVRTGMIVGVIWALSPWLRGNSWQHIGASVVMVGLLVGSAFVFRYDDRNVWMVYDALFAAPLIWLWRMLQQTSYKPQILLGMGLVIVWLDALRPFMLPFTPILVAVVAWHVWHVAGRSALPYLLTPLVITISWHAYHIIVLDQMSWSSHTGFNIARAWMPDLAMQTMAQTLPDMNSREYMALSNTLIAQSVEWILGHPWLALQRGISLLGSMLVVPVEMSRLNDGGIYTVITREIPWYVHGYRSLMIIGIIGQIIMMIRQMRHRRWSVAGWNACFVLAIIGISALTEYGEQARFIAPMAALLWFVDTNNAPHTS
ncbi:MAG: hypothetical protein ACO3F2_13240 [Roseiflexaceae bacterium]